MPQSLGMLGGKPNLAYYFIGFIGERGALRQGVGTGTRLRFAHRYPRILRSRAHTLRRRGADLPGPPHHAVSGGVGTRRRRGRPELPLPEDAAPHEGPEPRPLRSAGEEPRESNPPPASPRGPPRGPRDTQTSPWESEITVVFKRVV